MWYHLSYIIFHIANLLNRHLLMVSVFSQSYFNWPYFGNIKVKACNHLRFSTPEYICTYDELDNVHFNCKFKFFTISNIKRINSKFFYRGVVATCCCDYEYCTTSFDKVWTQMLRKPKCCLQRVEDMRWWESLAVAPTGNET